MIWGPQPGFLVAWWSTGMFVAADRREASLWDGSEEVPAELETMRRWGGA